MFKSFIAGIVGIYLAVIGVFDTPKDTPVDAVSANVASTSVVIHAEQTATTSNISEEDKKLCDTHSGLLNRYNCRTGKSSLPLTSLTAKDKADSQDDSVSNSQSNSSEVIEIEPNKLGQVTPPALKSTALPAVPLGTLCNNKYWSACPSGQDFVCPSMGGAYCSVKKQENIIKVTDAQAGTLCNGKYWLSCPSKQDFVCPSTGDAYCAIKNQNNLTTANTQKGTLCNGKYWSACISGQKLVCPANGDAYCAVPTQNNNSAITAQSGTMCNGTLWGNCPSGQKFVCPATGSAYCAAGAQQGPSALDQFSNKLNACTAYCKEKDAEAKAKLGDNPSWQDLLNYSAGPSCMETCTGVPSYKADQTTQSPVPSQSSVDSFNESVEKQKQEQFNRDTCQQLGGSFIAGKCVY